MNVLRRSRSNSGNKAVALSKILGTMFGAGTFVGYAHSVDKVNIIQSAAVIDLRRSQGHSLTQLATKFLLTYFFWTPLICLT